MLAILLALCMIIWICAIADAFLGLRRLDRLEDEAELASGPLLSIVTAARNEAAVIEESIRTQLAQNYTHLEWILVNDRSEDGTGEIMEKLAQEDARIRVLHIHDLPDGWLGKNHALCRGARMAKGDILLFTDADVMFRKDAIGRALSYFRRQGLDHLTGAPALKAHSFWLKAFIGFFLFGFSYYKRPWQANRPDDDLMLGMLMKRLGYRQKIAAALELLEVEWYTSLGEAFRGLEKNTFAGLHYRISMVLLAIAGTFISQVLPFFAVFSPDRLVMGLSAANIVLLGCLYTMISNRMTPFSPALFLVFPLTALLFIYSIMRASFLTFKRGGIVWRGTKYSLKELRQENK
ncbi:glycosyltransferase [Bacillus infantis]|uniref:glycosyltransferase n=1 Tax=Bacillus infantis TaxID=324767 RepID=UPI003CEDD7AA